MNPMDNQLSQPIAFSNLVSPHANNLTPDCSKVSPETSTATPVSHRKVTKKQLFSQLKQAILYKQRAVAFHAACQQTYNFASRSLDKKLAYCPEGKQVSLILDIDDCLVECSSYFAGMMDSDESMDTKRNNAWWERGQIEKGHPMPGALAFLEKYKDNPKVNITYLTSRSNDQRLHNWTVKMLRHHGFPIKDESHVRIASPGNSKDKQIKEIKEQAHIHDTLLMGDKLSDFGAGAPKNNNEERREWVHSDEIRSKWGRDFIVMPNPVYGMWETLTHKYKGDPDEANSQRIRALRWDEISAEGSIQDAEKANECIQGVLYVQSPAYDAYMLQLTNIAGDIAEERQDTLPSKEGAIFDIDGTVSSNSRWRSTLCLNDRTATQLSFNLWASKEKGEPIAGMKNLTGRLRSKGFSLHWVTNRPSLVRADSSSHSENSLREITRREMTSRGFMKETDQLFMRDDQEEKSPEKNRSKASRFEAIKVGANTGSPVTPVMHFGDAMMDLGINPEAMHEVDPSEWEASIRDGLGKSFFIVPNPPFSKGWYTHLKDWAMNKGLETKESDGESLSDRLITHWHLTDNKSVMPQPIAA